MEPCTVKDDIELALCCKASESVFEESTWTCAERRLGERRRSATAVVAAAASARMTPAARCKGGDLARVRLAR